MDERIREIKERLDKREVYHWKIAGYNKDVVGINGPSGFNHTLGPIIDQLEVGSNDAEFIASSPADVQFLLDALRAERQKVAELESMLKLVVGMCESIGSFSNGVTWQGMDEGDVMAQKVIDDARKLIDGD